MNNQKIGTTMKNQKNGYYSNKGAKLMITVGNYTILLIKKEQQTPVRLEKNITKKQKMEKLMNNNTKAINITLLIILMVLFIILCYHLVPQTYGFYHW